MKILVVVLNYNGAEETSECLRALVQQIFRNFDLYLVENSDHEKTKQKRILAAALEKAKINLAKFDIQPKNTGFAGGVNLGIKYAMNNNYDAVALLNSDAIPDKNWLENLVRNLDKWDASTGLMIEMDGKTIINTGDIYTLWGVPEQRDEHLPVSKKSKSGEIFGATGGAVLYKTEIFRKIGLFDEKLFAYNEDVDISWRARLAGYKFYYDSDAIVRHAGGTSSSSAFKTRQAFANLPVVALKNPPRELLWKILPRFVWAYIMFFGYKIIKLKGWSALRGFGRSIRFLPHILLERRKIQRAFKRDFSTKAARKKQIKNINQLINPHLPFKQLQRIKRFFAFKDPEKW